MRQSTVRQRLSFGESLAWHTVQALTAALRHLWRASQNAGWRLARQRTRRALAQLDDRMLADVGITREQALREAEKPFWLP